MEITKIAITGGPCGGKTTGLSYIERYFTKLGYKVVFVGETATELILSGLSDKAFADYSDFEKSIIKLQLLKEDYYYNLCKTLPYEKILLVCDRGAMDCKTYITQECFDNILKDLGMTEVDLRDNYDAVFHLVTAAKGAEEFYTTANNSARTETIEQARALDDKTINSWTGHPHLRVIDNTSTFEEKLKRLAKEICSVLGKPVPFEIERKFLIEKPDEEFLSTLPNCRKVDIIQTYLQTDEDETRIRQRGGDGSYIYTITTKKTISKSKRIENERRITEREYLTYLTTADTTMHQIKKTRYCLMHDNKYFEIDIYPFAKNKAICEIELLSEGEKFDFPPFIKVIKEVTDDKSFSNYSFAKVIPAEMD